MLTYGARRLVVIESKRGCFYSISAATYYNSIITPLDLELLMENFCADLDRSDARLLCCEM